MANKDDLQIPESERGELLATVSVDRSRLTRQTGGYRKTLVIGIVGVVFGLLMALGTPLTAGGSSWASSASSCCSPPGACGSPRPSSRQQTPS